MPPPPNPDRSFAALLAELLALRPEIRRLVTGNRNEPAALDAPEDRVQTVLERIYRRLSSWKPHPDGLKPWVSTVAFNMRRESRRARRRYDALFRPDNGAIERMQAPDPSPERRMQLKEAQEQLFEVLRVMPAEQLTVLFLVCYLGETHEEVAKQLGITEAASKMKLRRARDLLDEHFAFYDCFGFVPPALPLPASNDARRLRWFFDLVYRGIHMLTAMMAGSLLWPAPPVLTALAGITYELPHVGVVAQEGQLRPSIPAAKQPTPPRTSPEPFSRKGLGVAFRKRDP